MTVLGLPLVLANLARIVDQIVDGEEEGLEAAAEKVREAWVANIVSEGLVDTGRYRDSVEVRGKGQEVAVITDVPYARFLEFGTSRTPAHPAAERAFDEHAEELTGIVGNAIGGVIR